MISQKQRLERTPMSVKVRRGPDITWKDVERLETPGMEEKRGETGRNREKQGETGRHYPGKNGARDLGETNAQQNLAKPTTPGKQKNRAFRIAQTQQTTRTDKRLGFYY